MGGCTSRDADTVDATLQKPQVRKAPYAPKHGEAAVMRGHPQASTPASDFANGAAERQATLDEATARQPSTEAAVLPQGPFLTCKAAGISHIGYGPLKRENQDSISMEEHSRFGPGRSFYGVFDGHGSFGKPISQRASQQLPHFLELGLKRTQQDNGAAAASHDEIAVALSSAFAATEDEICHSPGLDAQNSGTTATVALLQGEDLWVAAVGDSSAILVQNHDRSDGPLNASSSQQAADQPGAATLLRRQQHENCPESNVPASTSTSDAEDHTAGAYNPSIMHSRASIDLPDMPAAQQAPLHGGAMSEAASDAGHTDWGHSLKSPSMDSMCKDSLTRPQRVDSTLMTALHRAGQPQERERLLSAGARVHPKQLPGGVAIGEPRMWLPDKDTPGLLLSRAIGDQLATTVGCIATPEIMHVTMQPGQDCFLVMASDGIWDVLTQDQVGAIVVRAKTPKRACKRLLRQALRGWQAIRAADNVAVVVVALQWADAPDACPPGTPSQASPPAAGRPVHSAPNLADVMESPEREARLAPASPDAKAHPSRGRDRDDSLDAPPSAPRTSTLRSLSNASEQAGLVTARRPKTTVLQSGSIRRVLRNSRPDSFGFVECEA